MCGREEWDQDLPPDDVMKKDPDSCGCEPKPWVTKVTWPGDVVYLTDKGCGCGAPGPSGCDKKCGSKKVKDECGVCGDDGKGCDQAKK